MNFFSLSLKRISVCPEDESLIMTDFVEVLSSVDVKQGKEFIALHFP